MIVWKTSYNFFFYNCCFHHVPDFFALIRKIYTHTFTHNFVFEISWFFSLHWNNFKIWPMFFFLCFTLGEECIISVVYRSKNRYFFFTRRKLHFHEKIVSFSLICSLCLFLFFLSKKTFTKIEVGLFYVLFSYF